MISPSVETRMRQALAVLESEADQLEAAVADASGPLESLWQGIAGTSSTLAAAAETSRQARKAAAEMRDRLVALLSDADATDDQGETFIRDVVDRAGVSASLSAAKQVTAGEGVGQVAKGTAGDIAAKLPSLSDLKWWGIAIGGAALLGLGLYAYAKAKG